MRMNYDLMQLSEVDINGSVKSLNSDGLFLDPTFRSRKFFCMFVK